MQIVTVTVDQLRALIREAVTEALAESRAPAEPTWLDTKGVAALLRIHPRSVGQYVRRGMPCKRVGPKTLRYERAAVLAWVDARKAG